MPTRVAASGSPRASGAATMTSAAISPKDEEFRMPTIFPVIAADDLTQRKTSKWVVRLGWTGSQPSHPFGEYVAKTLGYKRVAVFGTDYAFGYEVVGGFQRTFEEA